jgi:hypothetical protein
VIRRWRSLDLSGAKVVATWTKRSAANGDRSIVELDCIAGSGGNARLAVPLGALPAVEEMFKPRPGSAEGAS